MQTVSINTKPGDFAALAAQVREAGLLRRRPGYYRLKIVVTLAVFAVGLGGGPGGRELLGYARTWPPCWE